MKGKVFLTSCGLKLKEECDKLYEYLKSSIKGKRAIIITNATLTGHNERAIAPTKERFLQGGASVVDIVVLTKDNYKTILNYDFMYVVGGDNAPLLEIINSVDIRLELIKFLRNGGIYIGESAGAMTLGRSVKWNYDLKKIIDNKNETRIEPENCDGLNLTKYNIYPHYNTKTHNVKEIVKNFAAKTGITITPLNDGEWIELDIKDLTI